jgi:para-nitrobenzyl esterase
MEAGMEAILIARRRMLLAGAAVATGFAFNARAEAPLLTPVTATAHGRVQGRVRADGIHVFKGLRYGAPPTGAARFKPPQPPAPWPGIHPAFAYGAPAMQMPMGASAAPMTELSVAIAGFFSTASDMTIDNEDCLFLNVWTKALGAERRRPVMVWLHGGGYAYGSGGWPVYDGANLARRGDVVVVTINHRLNAFGYLYLAELMGEDYAASGNAGMLDIVLALQWVRDNIAAFGGDPGNVTIFGESGGGSKVSHLLAMPAAQGLFHKAIIQSGAGVTGAPRAEATDLAGAILRELNIAPGDAAALSAAHPDAVVAASAACVSRLPPDRAFRGLSPVVDGATLPRDPFAPDAPAISADIPVMIGSNKDEMSIFNASAPWWGRLTEEQAVAQTRALAGPRADALLAALRAQHPDYSPTYLFNAAQSALFFHGPTHTLAERKAAQRRAPVYLYYLTWETPAAGGLFKCPHALDLPLMFDNVEMARALLGEGEAPQRVADQMASAWIAFATTGDPNNAAIPAWPAYDARRRATMVFDAESRVVNDPIRAVRRALA